MFDLIAMIIGYAVIILSAVWGFIILFMLCFNKFVKHFGLAKDILKVGQKYYQEKYDAKR